MQEQMTIQPPEQKGSENTALAVQGQQTTDLQLGTFYDKATLGVMARYAERFANSKMVPIAYQGQPDNCFVAVEMAARMRISPMIVMQNLYPIQGNPSWAGKAVKGFIDMSGLFSPLDYVFVGEQGKPSWGCYCIAKRISDGAVIKGTTITMQMAQDEGWSTKAGSKWKTMPEQMLKYRAATFFARTECPGVLMGLPTMDEMEDIGKGDQQAEPVIVTVE